MSTTKVSFEKKGIKPSKDWNMVLFVYFVVLILLAGISSYFYMKVEDGTFFSVEEQEFKSGIKINGTMLKKVVDDINSREKSREDIKNGISVPSNPAL